MEHLPIKPGTLDDQDHLLAFYALTHLYIMLIMFLQLLSNRSKDYSVLS